MDGPERLEYGQWGHVTEQGGRLKSLHISQIFDQLTPSGPGNCPEIGLWLSRRGETR